jgi:hypothetical protein
VSRSLIVGTAKDKSTGRRIPAANLETLVITKLRSFLADEGAILNVIREEHVDGAPQSRLIDRGVKKSQSRCPQKSLLYSKSGSELSGLVLCCASGLAQAIKFIPSGRIMKPRPRFLVSFLEP